MTAIRPARMVTKSRPPVPTRGKRGDVGRFVTLRSGQKIFIPKGRGSKWADVRDEILVGAVPKAEPAEIETWEVGREMRRIILGIVTKEEIAEGFSVPGLKTRIDVWDAGHGTLSIQGYFDDPKTGEVVGDFSRQIGIYPDGKKVWHGGNLEFSRDFQNKGLATAFYDRQIALARKMGCDRMEIVADGSIGRYAWARKGYQYAVPGKAEFISDEIFPRWAKSKGIKEPSGGWPKFENPQEVANFRIKGISLRGENIVNPDVPDDMELHVGKAFMLDDVNGHRNWGATLKL